MGHETKLYIPHNFQTKNLWTHTSNSQYTFVARYLIISTHSHSYKYLGSFSHIIYEHTDDIMCCQQKETRCRRLAILFLNWKHRNEQVYVSSCCKSERGNSVGNFSLSWCLDLHPSIGHSISSVVRLYIDVILL